MGHVLQDPTVSVLIMIRLDWADGKCFYKLWGFQANSEYPVMSTAEHIFNTTLKW